jgi:hypothetical protein
MWPGECSGSKKFIYFNKPFLGHQSFYIKKYEGNAKILIFSQLKGKYFDCKKHHFWNFPSPASKKFFLANSNMPFYY